MLAWACLACAASPGPARAEGRPAGTGGLAELEGAGGGGLTPWALISGSGTGRELGGDAYCTGVWPQHFALSSCGLALGLYNRVELSVARLDLSLGDTVPGASLREVVVGAKWRLLGDAVIDQDRWWPQVSAGLQWKHSPDFDGVPAALGARRASGLDVYLAATKILLAGPGGRTWLASATLRRTDANQLGLLGFGGDRGDYRYCGEGSLVVFVTDEIATGLEYRGKPDHLAAFREQAFSDAVVSWLPSRHWSVTLAYARLGTIANHAGQAGAYASVQWVW